ncbi:MAG: HNH endonuclease [Methanothrix sp.]
MIEIPLSKGKTVLIDDIDADLADKSWFAHSVGGARVNKRWYAARSHRGERRGTTFMHRVILERMLGRGLVAHEETDHKNQNSLDNRRANLRCATPSENRHNQPAPRVKKTSRFKGVSWYKNYSKWEVQIRVGGQKKKIGYFVDEEEAARAYDEAAKRAFPTFAVLNFPTQAHSDGKELEAMLRFAPPVGFVPKKYGGGQC